jgi:hypothetical protein
MRRALGLLSLIALAWCAAPVSGQTLLVPMDGKQANHLRAYGLVYQSIAAGERAEPPAERRARAAAGRLAGSVGG